jgi:hypothetical protein
MDPGFIISKDGSSYMTAYPRKTWRGEHTFWIDNIVESS